MRFLNLLSIFTDKYVISSTPTHFENKESPIIRCKYNKPICSTVLNYNKLVSELDIESFIQNSIECKESKYCYQPAGHWGFKNYYCITNSVYYM